MRMNIKHTYITTSWTNTVLNNNVNMLEGAEFFRVTQSMVHCPGDENYPEHPNLVIPFNMVITNMGPKDQVSFTYGSMNVEQNSKIQKQLKIYYGYLQSKYLELNESNIRISKDKKN